MSSDERWTDEDIEAYEETQANRIEDGEELVGPADDEWWKEDPARKRARELATRLLARSWSSHDRS